MAQRHYEAVVLGGGLSACIAAALLSKRGFRVLIVDQGELASTRSGLLPDLVLAAEGSLAMELVHAELSLGHELQARTRPFAAGFQAILPDERVDLPGDRLGLLGEVKRAFGPATVERTREFMSALDAAELAGGEFLAEAGPLPAEGFFQRRSVATLAKRHAALGQPLRESERFRQLPDPLFGMLIALLPFVTYLDAAPNDRISVLRFVRPVARFLRGVHRLADDASFRELLVQHAQRGRTEVIRSAIKRLDLRGDQLDLEIDGEQASFTADALIDASADLSGLQTLPAKSKAKALGLMLQEAAPKGHLHAVSIEVDRDVLPPGMAENLLLANGRGRARAEDGDATEDRPILLLSRGSAVATPERVRLVALHPLSQVRSHTQGTDRLDLAIRARIERLVPFLEDGHPSFTPLSGQGNSEWPLIEHPLLDPELDPLMGVGGTSFRTPQKNVFVAGPTVLPGLGAEGEYIAALQAVDALEAQTRGKKIPKTLAGRPVPAGGRRSSVPPPAAG